MKIKLNSGIVDITKSGKSNYISIRRDTAIKLFQKIAIADTSFISNELGIYSLGSVGRDSKVTFASMGVPRHLLQRRLNGCIWNPKGRIPLRSGEVTLCPVEYNGEQCPDFAYDTCLEQLFGPGRDMRDLFATAEGLALFEEMIRNIYIGLGTSLYDLVEFGQHPLITLADENGWSPVTMNEWEDYVDQQDACGGFITMVDALKEEGLPHFNVEINPDDVDDAAYGGDAMSLIDRVISATLSDFSLVLNARFTSKTKMPVIRVSEGIFNRFKEQLLNKFGAIPDVYYYWMYGRLGVCKDGCSPQGQEKFSLPGVLIYNGYVIYNDPVFKVFDNITGTVTHRALLGAPGVFAVAFDIPAIKSSEDLGLEIVQHLDAPFKGKIFMDTIFKVGNKILDTNFVVNASLTLTP
ncbi:MAG TPA: hypothetical protein PLT61_09870 [Acinetobacter johnsonii]|nr:hypothetical protein [Acinetobacter johnsonii]